MGIMYNSNNVHVNGTQNLSLSLSLAKRGKTATTIYYITLLFVPLSPPQQSCPHHLPVRYIVHGSRVPLEQLWRGCQESGGIPPLPLRRLREREEPGEVPYVTADSALQRFDFRVEPPYGRQWYKKCLLCLQKAQYTSRCGLLCRR